MANERKAALDAALSKIEKQFGKGSIMKLGEQADRRVSTVSSGSLTLDVALGVGGYPRGRVVEIYGPESSGKTTVALHAIAEVQKDGGQAAFIDAEHALDPVYAEKLGVNTDELLLSQPDTGEHLSEAERLTSWWLILSRLSSRGRKSRARWAIPMSDCKPASCHRHCGNCPVSSASRIRSPFLSTKFAKKSG
jgi:hypothetical protein